MTIFWITDVAIPKALKIISM
jgi:hypothetical protein